MPKVKKYKQRKSVIREKHLKAEECLKVNEQGTLPNTFYETTITLIPKPDKDNTKKKTTGQYMNIDTKNI